MATEIYYFSGTGNSLFVAKELQNRIPDCQLIPIVSSLTQEKITPKAESIGFVYPVIMSCLPLPVSQFLKKLDLSQINYIFAVPTRIGTPHSSFHTINKFLKQQKKKLNCTFILNLPSNDPKFHSIIPNDDDIKQLEKIALSHLDQNIDKILRQENYQETDTNITQPLPAVFIKIVPALLKIMEWFKLSPKFYADEKCITCGNCEKICLSTRINMIDQKPQWNRKILCYNCYACLDFCPQQAVQIKNMTEENGRYSHPYATMDEMINQKVYFQ
ncbi:MAG: EFR1 family ferrodoxin [Spirochaetes bacterium]|nr:EFR1 family ferrodoxin [Spirochaetota bacterium]